MTTPSTKLPAWQLEQLALAELPPAEAAAARERLGADAETVLAALHADNTEILAAHPPAQVRAEVLRRLALQQAPTPRRTPVLWLGVPGLAVAALALVMVWPDADVGEPGDAASFVAASDPGATRIKGLVPHIVLHRQIDGTAQALETPATARPGDVLQLSYIAAAARYGVIASLDGRGVATLHFPAAKATSTALQQAGPVRLDQAYELDDAPGFERFVFVTAATPVEPARVLAALQALAQRTAPETQPLELPATWQQHSLVVAKESP